MGEAKWLEWAGIVLAILAVLSLMFAPLLVVTAVGFVALLTIICVRAALGYRD